MSVYHYGNATILWVTFMCIMQVRICVHEIVLALFCACKQKQFMWLTNLLNIEIVNIYNNSGSALYVSA